jgi:hypothetical protein
LILVLVIENVHASKALDVQIFNWGISELNSTLFLCCGAAKNSYKGANEQ